MRTALLSGLGVAALTALAGTAHAGVITAADLTLGQPSVNLNVDGVAVTVTAVNGNFAQQSFRGVQGVGVGGGTFPEVDGVEALVFDFSTGVTITGLEFAHLYHQNVFTENNNESVEMATTQGTFELMAMGTTTATFDGNGTVANFSPSASNAGAGWTITGADLFNGLVTQITFTPGSPGVEGDDDDFSFVSLSFVPTPGAGALFACAGLLGLRRRR